MHLDNWHIIIMINIKKKEEEQKHESCTVNVMLVCRSSLCVFHPLARTLQVEFE